MSISMCESWRWALRVLVVTAKFFVLLFECVFLQRKHGAIFVLHRAYRLHSVELKRDK